MRVVGYHYIEGLKILYSLDRFPSRIVLVKPPHAQLGLGSLRIIGERERARGNEVLLSYEEYE